ncbi:hypothetical protein ACNOYE_32510 [Nannocystaceae bacterium ST9]
MAPLPADIDALLVEQVRLHQRMWRVGGLGLAGLMLACSLVAWFALEPAESREIVGLAGIGVLAALAIALPSFGDPRRKRAMKTLCERTGEIVWIYPAELRGQGSSQWVVLGLEDGSRVWFPAFSKGREPEVFRAVARVVPHATRGFTPDDEMAFLRDPSSLRVKAPR